MSLMCMVNQCACDPCISPIYLLVLTGPHCPPVTYTQILGPHYPHAQYVSHLGLCCRCHIGNVVHVH